MTSPQEYLKSHHKLKNKYKTLLTRAPQIHSCSTVTGLWGENGQLEKYMSGCTGNESRLWDFGGDADEDNGFYTASSLTGGTHKCSVMAGIRDVLAQRRWTKPKSMSIGLFERKKSEEGKAINHFKKCYGWVGKFSPTFQINFKEIKQTKSTASG